MSWPCPATLDATPLTWIWSDAGNYEGDAGGPGYAMDGSRDGPGLGNGTFTTFISLNWNYSDINHIIVTPLPGGIDTFGNNINYSDQMISGTIAAVPEPETYALMLAGLAAVAFVGKRRRAA